MDLNSLLPSLPSSSSSRMAIFDFPLDPSLGGPVASGSNTQNNIYGSGQINEFEDDSDSESDSESEEDEEGDEEDGDSEDSEDANAEYEAAYGLGGGGGKKRKRILTGGTEGKGKGRAVDVGVAVKGSNDRINQAPTEGFEDRQELGRLISAIRETTNATVGGRTALDKEFDRSIQEELDDLDADDQDDHLSTTTSRRSTQNNNSLASSGYPKKRAQPRRLGQVEPEPSPEVKSMLGRANQHYANGESDEALLILFDVIRIDPNVRSTWYTLATIHEERGETKKVIEFKIVAAHLNGVKSGAKEWAELADQAREFGLIQQAIHCFTQAIKGNKADTDSMWDRAVLLNMSGESKKAITAFVAILNLEPHNSGVLRALIPLLIEEEAYSKATELLTSAFEYHQLATPHISDESTDSPELFNLGDLETLADLLIIQKFYSKAITCIKSGVRWLQQREMETMWESMLDDREFDLSRRTREGWEKDNKAAEGAAINELDPRLRVRLGTARMGEGRIDEAKYHFDVILQEDVAEFPELYGAVADAYFEKKFFAEALNVYQEMATNDDINGPLVWMKAGQCSHELGELEDARECYEAVTADSPDNIQAKMQLARLYEQMNEPAKALAMITDVIAAQKHIREEGALEAAANAKSRKSRQSGSRPPLTKEGRIARQADRLAAEELRHNEFAAAFQKLGVLDPAVDEGDSKAISEWLELATYLVDSFRETTQLFPSDPRKKFRGVLTRNWTRKGTTENMEKQAGEMASRLERNLDKDDQEVEANSFRGLHFDKWLALIIKYAFILTKNDEVEAGIETLSHVSAASPFKQSEQRSISISLARIACSYHVRDYAKVLEVARAIWVRFSYRTDALKLFQCLLPSGIACIETFNTTPLQKYTIRQLKGIAASAEKNGGIIATTSSKGKGKAVAQDDDVEDEPEAEQENQEDDDDDEEEQRSKSTGFKPTKLNPLYLTTYGAMLLTSKSYQSAIIYLLRAYDISPEEPLLNLTLGIAYIHRAMSRQTDNRQHQIAQGLAFISQYRKVLGKTQETEYNLARAYHHLGQHSFAVKHYEEVLKLATVAQEARMVIEEDGEDDDSDKPDDPHDFSKVAAYNLSQLYVYSGLPDLGRQVARKWLSV